MSRRFLVESEEVAARAPEVLYHAGEPALWALILLEAGTSPDRQAAVLRKRLAEREDCPLKRFAICLDRCFSQQKRALQDVRDFLLLREEALCSAAEANALADMICAQSSSYEHKRAAQAKALRALFDMKELTED